MSTTSQKERFHFLDGLRGIASLMIVIHHSLTANIAAFINKSHIPYSGEMFSQFTQSGVDLFFVLSGVVLLRPYLRGQRQFKVGDYFIRRIKRIYPPYFFALLFGAFVVWFMGTYPTWYNVRGMHIPFSWLETFKESFIFSTNENYYNLAWWSLQIEILFYIAVPAVVLTFPKPEKLTIQRIIITILATYGAAFALQELSTNYTSWLYSYTYHASVLGKFMEYPVCFLMGILLAARDFNITEARNFMIAGIVLVIAGIVLMDINYVFISLLHSGYGLFYAGVITMAFRADGLKRFLSKPIMIWLGERSYSLFLIHFSVFYLVDNNVARFTGDRTAIYGLATRIIGIPLAFFFAMLLFYFVERKQARGLLTDKAFWPWQVKGLKLD